MNNDDMVKIIQKRYKVSLKYCEENDLNIDDLSFSQVLKIRSLPEWQQPLD